VSNRDLVAFQGVHGAYSEQAIRQHFGDSVDVYPCPDFNTLLSAIQNREVRYGLLPIENALAGAVRQAYELLLDYDLRIQAEVILHVHHALLAPPGSKAEDLTHVRSHPQALAQCDKYLKRAGLEPIPSYDTAGSARMISEQRDAHIGAIASKLAGELYNLDILDEEIEDVPFNFTRFFVLGHDDPPRAAYNKTSVVFATRHHPSALYDCLGEFASRGLNLTKIESRPRRNRPWEPVFYVDFEGHWQEPDVQETLVRLLQRTAFIKMLGSYPAIKTKSVGI
jgi:prephenate dehydratase